MYSIFLCLNNVGLLISAYEWFPMISKVKNSCEIIHDVHILKILSTHPTPFDFTTFSY